MMYMQILWRTATLTLSAVMIEDASMLKLARRNPDKATLLLKTLAMLTSEPPRTTSAPHTLSSEIRPHSKPPETARLPQPLPQ